ncbi:Spo0E family sporulation regulatory protein-aspartic acid phosphatase [Brevibacillus sp. SYSU BS000544]|uniref:Spo0E family sporulation regulatory protein-aspartic acid phosphatase n=1 Tax=Brevibacillus sp. SYSU BS000544 TaxID=3416443 RepID=UPI003CE53E7F
MREQILEKIELLRQQMISIGLEHGLDHPDVLFYSQQIDLLHNKLLEIEKEDWKNNQLKRKICYKFFLYESRAHFA